MDRYIGLDAHDESCTFVVKSGSGRRVRTQVVETHGERLVAFVESVPRPRRLILEEGTLSTWLYELFEPHVDELAVVIPERRGPRSKSDEKDAENLAEKLRLGGAQRRVYKKVAPVASLRAAVRSYMFVSRDKVRVQNRLRSLYRSRGLGHAGAEVYDPAQREPWVAQLPASQRSIAKLLGEELDKLTDLTAQAEKQVQVEGRRHQAVKVLQTIPGIGQLRAAVVVAVVVNPRRFRTVRQFWSYAGLGIVTVASAQWSFHDGRPVRRDVELPRGLNRNRNPFLKTIFKGAAHTIIHNTPDEPLHQRFLESVASGVAPHRAKLTLARRVAAVTLALWKRMEVYDPEKSRRQPRG